MPIFPTSIIPAAATTSTDPVVERGLRFEDGDTPSLERTVTSAGSSRKFTISLWAKRGKLGALTPLFSAAASGYEDILLFNSDDTLVLHARSGSDFSAVTSAKFRDTSAFYHIVASIDTEQSTASDRLKIYVNGTLQSYTGTPTEDYDFTAFNAAVTHYLGFYAASSYYYDGTFADVYFLDGTAKVASDFAEENSNGQWVPKATSFSGSDYGDNGFHIDFVGGHDSELLLQSNHKQGSTNFEDSSGAGHYGITTSGDPQHSIKVGSPFTGDDRSIYFDGDGDYLSIGAGTTTDWDFGTGDFTIECWVNFSGSMSVEYSLMGLGFDSTSDRFYLRLGASFDAKLYFYVDDAGAALTSSSTYEADRWYHVAVVREGDDWTLYVDGVAEDTETNTGSWTAIDDDGPLRIGDSLGTQYQMSGFMYDIRVIKGTAAYTGNFTPPSGNLTKTGGTYPSTTNVNTSITASHTKLLIQPHQTNDSDWKDNSESDHEITGAGDLSTYADPIASTPYAGVGEKSAIYFDGTDDFLYMPDSDDWSWGDDWTAEFWVNFDSINTDQAIWHHRNDSSNCFLLYKNSSNAWCIRHDTSDQLTWDWSPSANTWYHIAFVDNGGTVSVYVDGVALSLTSGSNGSYSVPSGIDATVRIGERHHADMNLGGYLFDLRITKGEARYTSNFTAPATPFESTAVIHPGGDSSGKRNHFDVVNLGMGDVVRDCPESGGNFCTINPLNSSNITHSEGNLKTSGSDNIQCEASIYIPDTGSAATSKFYWEVKHTGTYPTTGYRDASSAMPSIGDIGYEDSVTQGWSSGGTAYSGGGTSVSLDETFSTGDIIMFAVDVNAGKSWLGLNGTWVNSGNPATGANETMTFSFDSIAPYASHSTTYPSESTIYNFGQDGSFAGNHTGTLVTGGGGEWAYAPPTGFKALKTDNISTTSATTFSYTGNESTDGPFIYMGYRPSSVTIGGTTYDDDDYNPSDDGIDWLANGIKIRTDALTINESGTTYSITAAPKELDFKYGTAR